MTCLKKKGELDPFVLRLYYNFPLIFQFSRHVKKDIFKGNYKCLIHKKNLR